MALATVVATWGSAPRPVGSHLAINDEGAFGGSVSGGCIEAAVIAAGVEIIADGRPRTLAFGVADETAWSVGLPCGGKVRVFVEPVGSWLADLQALRRERRAAARLIDISSGAHALVTAESVVGDLAVEGPVLAEARSLLVGDESRPLSSQPDAGFFLRSYGPPWELVIVGAVHIAQALAPIAAAAGFAVTVIDPRSAFAAVDRFPGVRVVAGWPDRVLAQSPPGAHTALVTLTHDAKVDDPALTAGLRSQAFYLGALGSRRNHERRLERLAAAGFGPADLGRIAGPAGLDIGARTPAEIAIAIAAEIVAARRTRRNPG